jgi:2-keto-4-pentenoate hydratase/2-oxohepta-3-ene-1,7-dioic acid hydratase in catechol pathway
MRIVAFEHGGRPALGARVGDRVVPFARLPGGVPADGAPALLARGPEYLAELGRRAAEARPEHALPLAGLALLPPVPQPGKVVCIGLNYVQHAREGGNPIPDYPAVFLRCATSLVGPGRPLLRPVVSPHLDYEAELAVVIGRRAKHVPETEALACVAGYACFNDGSVRDYQRKSPQWTVGKNFDATGGFGPELVTADELPPGAHGLRIQTRVNGRVLQDSNTADMIFPVARLVALMSEAMTLEPGDVIATGTPSGVGYARKPPVWLAPGDVCKVEIEGIGTLSNPIADEAAAAARAQA